MMSLTNNEIKLPATQMTQMEELATKLLKITMDSFFFSGACDVELP